MQTIQSVGIIGRGAIGALYGTLLQQGGVNPVFIVDPARRQRYEEQPLRINGRDAQFTYQSEGKPLSLILITTKYAGLAPALEQIRGFVDANTLILPCLNGITSEEIARTHFSHDQVIRCIVQGMDSTYLGNEVRYSNIGEILIGADSDAQRDSVDTVRRFFDSVHIPCRVCADILREQWNKLMLNCGINQVCAVYRCGYGACQQGQAHQEEFIAAMKEVMAIANAQGIDLRDQDIAHWVDLVNHLAKDAMPSMAQDILSKRKTEVALFSGTLVPLAKQHHLCAPVLTSLMERIIKLEESFVS